MKIKELRGMTREELLQKEKSLRETLFKLNMQRYGGRVEKPHQFQETRKDIARIQTLLNSAGYTKDISRVIDEKKEKK